MNALTNPEIGKYLDEYFVATFQKVGTFQIVGNQKQGGNVASYFCTPEGRVLHVLAGPVNADTLLREARWVEETWKLAQLEAKGDPVRLRTFFRKAHLDRIQQESGQKMMPRTSVSRMVTPADVALVLDKSDLSQQGRLHWLLATFPLISIETAYRPIFERILGEKVSTNPVVGG
jgi:hypothetical protein